jgi:hypothetical protein
MDHNELQQARRALKSIQDLDLAVPDFPIAAIALVCDQLTQEAIARSNGRGMRVCEVSGCVGRVEHYCHHSCCMGETGFCGTHRDEHREQGWRDVNGDGPLEPESSTLRLVR